MLVKTDCYALEAAKTKKHNLVLYIFNLKNVVLLIYQAQAKKKEKEEKEKEKRVHDECRLYLLWYKGFGQH